MREKSDPRGILQFKEDGGRGFVSPFDADGAEFVSPFDAGGSEFVIPFDADGREGCGFGGRVLPNYWIEESTLR